MYLQAFQDLRIGGRSTATEYQYSLTADDLKHLNEWGPKLMAAMDKLPQIKDVATDQQQQGLRGQLVIDRDDSQPAGSFAADDRCNAVGCIWAGAGFDDLYAAEPVSRGDGGCAGVPAGSGCVEEYLCEEHDGSDGSAVGRDALRGSSEFRWR